MKLNNFFFGKLNWAPDGTQGGGEPAQPVTPAPAAAPAAAPEAPDLSFIPADYQVDGKPDLAAFTAHYQDLVARDAQAAERAAALPEAYDFSPSQDLKFDGLDLPEGFTVEMDRENPAYAPLYEELGGLLKELGAPATAATKVSDLLARYSAAQYAQAYAANKAEMAALGTPAQQSARLSAIERAMQTRLPEAQMNALKAATTTAAGVQALEALLRPAGVTMPPSQPSTPDIEGMTAMEKLRLANSSK